jgi:hypothetical protein
MIVSMLTLSEAPNPVGCGHNNARKSCRLPALGPFAGLRVTFLESPKDFGFGSPLVILEKAAAK